MVVVAPSLPVARFILSGESNTCDPFGTFPEVQARHHQPDRPSVLCGERRAIVINRKKDVRLQEIGESEISCVAS